jgi:hypothetical protein
MISAALGVVQSVERAMAGDTAVRTAEDNAWEAVCADRARALHRENVRQRVASIAAANGRTGQVSVGSSPRSSASQAATVLPVPASSRRAAARRS